MNADPFELVKQGPDQPVAMIGESDRDLLIYGGTFDPPHRAHIELPKAACQKLGADAVVYIPAARSPHKLDQAQTPANHRVAMLRRALVDQPWARLWLGEIERQDDGPSYTVDTLERLRVELGEAVRMRLLIGADQIEKFETWVRHDRIIELAESVVMLRPPVDRENLPPTWRVRVVEVPAIDISSTRVRQAIEAGRPIDDMVPLQVAQYIHLAGLYQAW
jgi:nicotinate-nucleotide adenylyltransferase